MSPDGENLIPDDLLQPSGQKRPRVVLYSSLIAVAVAGLFVALLATSKPAGQGTNSSPLIGKPAPSIAGPTLTGSTRYSLGQFRGRWVVVNFAASWCVPCRQETPQLVRFANEHATDRSAVIVAVEFDETDKANLASFLRSSDASWPAVDDPGAEVAYGVTGIPESYLLDPAGTVVAKLVGGVTAAQLDGLIGRLGSR